MLNRDNQNRLDDQSGITKLVEKSQNLFQEFVEQVDIGFAATDETGLIILWNPALAKLTGFPTEQALGRLIWDVQFSLAPAGLQTSADLDYIRASFLTLLTAQAGGDQVQKLDFKFSQLGTGTRIALQQNAYTISIGEKKKLFCVYQQQPEAGLTSKAALINNDEKFRKAVEQAHDGILIIDAQETILEWNAGWEQLTGIEREHAIGLNITDLMPELFQGPEWAAANPNASLHDQITYHLNFITRTMLPHITEWRMHHNSGTYKWVQAVTFPILTGDVLLFGTIARDITSLKQTEERLQRYARQLDTLRQSGLEISAELGLDSLIWTIAPRALELLNGTGMALYLHDPQKDILELAISLGENQPAMEKLVQRGEALAGKVWETNESVLMEDYHTGHTHEFTQSYWGKVAGAPIVWGKEFLGVVFVFSDTKFFESDLKILELLSSHAAAAIRNARLHQQLSQLAVTDSLTGIYNRRHFFEMAEKEFHQAIRYKRSFSIIMFDLDLFKKVNDTYGHTYGDEVLRMVVQRCAAAMREADVLGRYGGEEFIIALPETGEVDAMALAERLREALASCPVEFKSAPALVTASFGIASLGPDIVNLMDLINRADVALYRVKQTGRNQVMLWDPSFENENPI